MESQPQNHEFRINPEIFHPCRCAYLLRVIPGKSVIFKTNTLGVGGWGAFNAVFCCLLVPFQFI